MPKLTTHRGAAKRFKKTGTGKLMRKKGWDSHLLVHKAPKRKRQLKKATVVSKADKKRIKRLLPYA